MATPHFAISVIDLRALRRIYCHGVPRSQCGEGHLKKLGWYISLVIAALATLSHLSFCSDRHIWMPVSPSLLWFRSCDGGAWAQAEHGEQAQGLQQGGDLKGSYSWKGKDGRDKRWRISQPLDKWTCCLQKSITWLTKAYIQKSYPAHCLGSNSGGTDCRKNSQLAVFSVGVFVTKWKCFLYPGAWTATALDGYKPCTSQSQQLSPLLVILCSPWLQSNCSTMPPFLFVSFLGQLLIMQ